MTCDQAFEWMTDPLGPTSPELRQHLAQCARCRQMLLTLAPLLEWLRPLQTLCEEPGQPLPAGTTCVTRFSTAKPEQPAHQGSVSGSRPDRAAWKRGLAFLLLLVTGAGGGVSWQGIHRPSQAEGPSSGVQLTASLWQSSPLREPKLTSPPTDGVMSCLMCHLPAGWQ